MKISGVILNSLFLLVAFGCGDEGIPPGVLVTDSAGIRHVDNSGPGSWRDAEPRLVEELRIGAVDGPAYLNFGDIAALDWDSEDNLYVLDFTAGNVRVFRPDGGLLGEFGQKGSGPGEFRSATNMAITADTVFVLDQAGGGRVLRFSLDGTYSSEGASSLAGGTIASRWRVAPTGRIIEHLRLTRAIEGIGADFLISRLPGSGAVDTLTQLPSTENQSLMTSSGLTVTMLGGEPTWDITAAGKLLVALTSRMRFEVRDQNGGIELVAAREVQPIPVPEKTKEALRSQSPQDIGGMPVIVSIPENYPAMSQIVAGPQGTVIIERGRTQGSAQDGLVWDFFDEGGAFLGEVSVPAGFKLYAVRGESFWGVLQDELGVPFIVRMRLEGFRH